MSLLAAYYNSIAAENAAKAQLDYANVGLTNANAAEVAPNAAAQRAEGASRANNNNAGANRLAQEAAQVAPNALSTRGLQYSQAQNYDTTSRLAPGLAGSEIDLRGAQTLETGVRARHEDISNQPLDFDTSTQPQGDAKGGKILTKGQVVHGKSSKPGPTDTVPTMLTPGEGVLNKGAMEHYGTDVLNHMNKMGLMRMGAQSEAAAIHGLPDPHAVAKGKDAEGKKKMGKDGKPAVKTDIPGFSKGGKVMATTTPAPLPVLGGLVGAPPSGMPLLHPGLYKQ